VFDQNIPGTIILFGSYTKKTYNDESDIDIAYIGKIIEKELSKIKQIGELYGKKINVKKVSLKNFEKALKEKDPLVIEIIKNHILLQNPEQFINSLWRYYNEKK